MLVDLAPAADWSRDSEEGYAASQAGHFREAEVKLRRALEGGEKQGVDEVRLSRVWLRLAVVLDRQSKSKDAEPFARRAIAALEKSDAKPTADLAVGLNVLVSITLKSGRTLEADALSIRSLAIAEACVECPAPILANSLGTRAGVLLVRCRYDKAEPLQRRALEIIGKSMGVESPEASHSLDSLAMICLARGKLDEAESLSLRSIAIQEKRPKGLDEELANSLGHLAEIQITREKFAAAEATLRRAVSIREGALGKEHRLVADFLQCLAGALYSQQKYPEALILSARSCLRITERWERSPIL